MTYITLQTLKVRDVHDETAARNADVSATHHFIANYLHSLAIAAMLQLQYHNMRWHECM